jgi:hypothetical protein
MAEGFHTKNRNNYSHRKLLNMVETTKEWEIVHFKAKSINSSEADMSVELIINHMTKQYNINSDGKKMVEFESDKISDSELKLEAIKAAIEYLKTNLK